MSRNTLPVVVGKNACLADCAVADKEYFQDSERTGSELVRGFCGARQVLVASPLRPLEHAEDSTVPAAGQAMVMLRIAYAKQPQKSRVPL